MCNLYSVTTNQEAIRRLFRIDLDRTGNLALFPGVYPDYAAPIVRNSPEGRELTLALWGKRKARPAASLPRSGIRRGLKGDLPLGATSICGCQTRCPAPRPVAG